VEPKKKTGTMRALLLAVSAFAMLLTGVFVSTSASATPEASNGCPEDFALAADGSSCFQLAQSQTTTTAPKCAEGTLTPSGTHCYLPAVVTPQTRTDVVANVPNVPAPVYTCPAGSTGTGSGASLTCSKTVDASTQEAVVVTANPNTVTCPAGFSGTPVEGGTCTRTVTANTQEAVIVTANPNIVSCPAGFTGTPVSGGTCSRTVTANTQVAVETVATAPTVSCPAGTTGTPVAGGTCTRPGSVTNTATPTCAANQTTLASGNCKATTGQFTTVAAGSSCAAGTEQDGSAHADGSIKCFPAVPPSTCPAGFTYNAGAQNCTQTVAANTEEPVIVTQNPPTFRCPTGSTGTPVAGGTCTVAGTATESAAVIETSVAPTITCPAGTSGTPVAGGTCTRPGTASESAAVVVTANAPTITCPAGTSGTPVAGGTCTRPGTAQQAVQVNVSQAATTFTCPAGFTGAGSGAALTCSKTVAVAPLVTCKNGSAPQDAGNSQNVCIVGPATTMSATTAYCAKGVLSSDKTKCVLSAGTTSSIAPAFTG